MFGFVFFCSFGGAGYGYGGEDDECYERGVEELSGQAAPALPRRFWMAVL